jgi:diguanylate cyclase (GGDEF)-like protein
MNDLTVKITVTIAYGLIMFMKPTRYATVAMKEFFELEKLHEEFKKASYIDELTRVYQRSFLPRARSISTAQAIRNNASLVCIVVDLDSLKGINDEYGHPIGDLALQASADKLRDIFRGSDFIIRTGGDEFVILVYTTEPEILYKRLDKLLISFDLKFKFEDCNNKKNKNEEVIQVSFSYGHHHISFHEIPREILSPEYIDNIHESLYKNADAKMYEAKFMKKFSKQ